MTKKIALAFTGASGAQYGLRLLECLLAQDVEVSLMLSKPAQVVIGMETSIKLPSRPADIRRFFLEYYQQPSAQLNVYDREQWTAPVASGSARMDAMVVCPCTTATLAAIATGQSNNLIERAADVSLKERRPLILVVRETPFSDIHLNNMLTLSRMGAVIMPANPGFYHQPQTVDDLVDFMVARILDHLAVPHGLMQPWGESSK